MFMSLHMTRILIHIGIHKKENGFKDEIKYALFIGEKKLFDYEEQSDIL